VHFCFQPYYSFTFVIIPCISLYSYTCWVPTINVLNLVVLTLRLKPTTQKIKMVGNSSMRSSRLALPRLDIPMDYGAFCCSTFVKESFSLLKDVIYVIIILYSRHLKLLWTFFVCMCGINISGHICDKYSVLVTKPGMTHARSWLFMATLMGLSCWALVAQALLVDLDCYVQRVCQSNATAAASSYGPTVSMRIRRWLGSRPLQEPLRTSHHRARCELLYRWVASLLNCFRYIFKLQTLHDPCTLL
jgi:hypothetical protein